MAANWLQNRVLHGNEEKRASRDSGLEGLTRTAAARWLRAQVAVTKVAMKQEMLDEVLKKVPAEHLPFEKIFQGRKRIPVKVDPSQIQKPVGPHRKKVLKHLGAAGVPENADVDFTKGVVRDVVQTKRGPKKRERKITKLVRKGILSQQNKLREGKELNEALHLVQKKKDTQASIKATRDGTVTGLHEVGSRPKIQEILVPQADRMKPWDRRAAPWDLTKSHGAILESRDQFRAHQKKKESLLKGALGEWKKSHKLFSRSRRRTPPSESEIKEIEENSEGFTSRDKLVEYVDYQVGLFEDLKEKAGTEHEGQFDTVPLRAAVKMYTLAKDQVHEQMDERSAKAHKRALKKLTHLMTRIKGKEALSPFEEEFRKDWEQFRQKNNIESSSASPLNSPNLTALYWNEELDWIKDNEGVDLRDPKVFEQIKDEYEEKFLKDLRRQRDDWKQEVEKLSHEDLVQMHREMVEAYRNLQQASNTLKETNEKLKSLHLETYGDSVTPTSRRSSELSFKINNLSTLKKDEKNLARLVEKSMTSRDDALTMVVSRAPIDVLRMSDHPHARFSIQSCHSVGGSYFHCAVDETTKGGAIAYLVDTNDLEGVDLEDDEIFLDNDRGVDGVKPYGRVRLHRFEDENGNEIAVPAKRNYGDLSKGFDGVLRNWAWEQQPDLRPEDFDTNRLKLRGGDYLDNKTGVLFEAMKNSAPERPAREEESQGSEGDFWSWANETHPRVPNPNRDGRQRDITPNTLKGYAESGGPYSQQAQRAVEALRTKWMSSRRTASQWLRAQVNLSDKVRDPETNKEITRKWFCEKYPDKCQTTRKAPESYRQNFEDTPQGINQQIQQLNKDTPAYKHPSGQTYQVGTQVTAVPSGRKSSFRNSKINGGEFNNVFFSNATSDENTKLKNLQILGGDWSGVDFQPRRPMKLRDSYNENVRDAVDEAGLHNDDLMQALIGFYSKGSKYRQKNLFGLGSRLNRKQTHDRIIEFQKNHYDYGGTRRSDPTANYSSDDMKRLSDKGWKSVQDYAIKEAQKQREQKAQKQQKKKQFNDLRR